MGLEKGGERGEKEKRTERERKKERKKERERERERVDVEGGIVDSDRSSRHGSSLCTSIYCIALNERRKEAMAVCFL